MWRKAKVRCYKDTDPDDRVISAILIGCYISPIKLKEQTAHFIFYSLNFLGGVCFLRRIEVFFPFVQLRWQLAGLLGNAWPAHPAVLISYYIYIFIYTAEFYTIHCLPFDVNERIKKCGGENSNCVSTSIIAFRMGSVFLLFAFPKLAVIFWRTHASHRNIAPWEISRSFFFDGDCKRLYVIDLRCSNCFFFSFFLIISLC